jgi:hypothetical protein
MIECILVKKFFYYVGIIIVYNILYYFNFKYTLISHIVKLITILTLHYLTIIFNNDYIRLLINNNITNIHTSNMLFPIHS